MFAPVGTSTNMAVRKYLNDRKIPQLLLQSGISKFNDPKNFPWSLSGLPNHETEVRLRQAHPCRQVAGQGRDSVPER
jgi:branched-chain amino acid transport system substrate-binding protein